MSRLRWLDRSVQKIVEGAGPVGGRLVRDWVVGVYLAGTVILSGVARVLRADKPGFEAVLERLSRGLKRQGKAIRSVCARYRERAAQAARRWGFEVVAIDLSEIVKPCGRKMPYLCRVRDGSKSNRRKRVLQPGWWTVEIAATRQDHMVLPMWRHAYSTVHPSFKSVTKELRHALEQIKSTLWPGARAVLDRGFDGNSHFRVLDEYFELWAVRQRGDRDIYLPGQDDPVRVSTLAKAIRKDLVARPLVVRRGQLQRIAVACGHCTIDVPTKASRRTQKKPPCRRMSLVVAHRQDPTKLPVMLLTSRPVRSPAQARQWLEDYYRRWAAEDETRGAKQLSGLEDLRVLSWKSISNIVALSVVTQGLLALIQVEAPRRAARLARLAPIDGDVPAYALYRIWVSVAVMLRGRRLSR